jgi:dTDP-4-dehydrorhamnose reductase
MAAVGRARGFEAIALGREDVDVFDSRDLGRCIDRHAPDCVCNAVGFTAVDLAEDEPEKAYALNRGLPQALAEILKGSMAWLITFSTDYVFDGRKQAPYLPDDPPNPLSVYGASKLAGERSVLESGPSSVMVIRTSWLFGPWKTNFVQKMVDFSKDRSELAVVHDQVGSPTYTCDLAEYAYELLRRRASGMHHLSNSGQASWCELAAEAVGIAGTTCQVAPITSEQYPQKAKRPNYSVLDCSEFTRLSGYKPRPWLQALREYMFSYQSDRIACED